jgi:phosphoribosylformimino-5-aminoimidazole carboxamide ribotide isomerase
MKVFPAIDIMNGKVVRLFKGKKDDYKIYGEPVDIAKKLSKHFDYLHVIDLDGAFEGAPQILDILKDIKKNVDIKIQTGGGYRDYESVKRAYEIGVDNVIISTSAYDIDFLKRVTSDFYGITISLDFSGKNIMTKGWLEKSEYTLQESFEKFKEYTDRFIITDTSKDGTLSGIEKIDRFWGDERVIYAGGIRDKRDLDLLSDIGFYGAVTGKALYENSKELFGSDFDAI